MRRAAAGVEAHSVVNGRWSWSWSAGVEIANRNFRNLNGHGSLAEGAFFAGVTSVAGWLSVERTLMRVAEHRFMLDSTAEAKAGREFADSLGPFVTLRGSLRARWFPRAKGDDYEMQTQIRAGATAGKATLDELFEFGVERDNDLWLRGHAETLNGRTVAAYLRTRA